MRVVTFGEVMLRLAPEEFLRLRQAIPGRLEATFGGGELNVAVSVAFQGGRAAFLSVLPDDVVTDAFVQAGLLAREALDAGSRFVGIFSSSAQIGAFFESRATASTATQLAPPAIHFPPNYTQMYLRLQRTGNVFNGFASFDGRTWEQISTATMALPASVFFG